MSYASLEQAQRAAARLQRRQLLAPRASHLDPTEGHRERRRGLHNSKLAGGLGAALLAAAAACWLGYGEPASAEVQGYRITHGDKVSVTVYGQTELSGDFVVD